jgi:hypothetical protein
MLRSSRKLRNTPEKSCSSCIVRIISSRAILGAVQAVMDQVESSPSKISAPTG